MAEKYMQEPHNAADCKQNDAEHSSPEFDCGHPVAGGPDEAPKKELEKTNDYGKECIVAGEQ